MNAETRQFVFVVVGIAAVAGAAWHMAVSPLMGRLEGDRARLVAWDDEIARARHERSASDRSPRDVVTELRRDAAEYERLWAIGADAPAMYESLQMLASNAGVRIERLDPRSPGGFVSRSDMLIKELGLEVETSHSGYKIECAGEFDAVARFVESVQRNTGLTRIESVHMQESKSAEPGTPVRATINTIHVSLQGALQDVTDADDAPGSDGAEGAG